MNKMIRKYYPFFNVLLFSGLGCFSYYFLVQYADIPIKYQELLTSVKAFAIVICIFNTTGLGFIFLSKKIRNAYPLLLKSHRMVFIIFILSAILLFVLNYFLLVYAKWMIDVQQPFLFKWSGGRMLLIIWLVELIIVSQIMVNNFYRHLIVLYERTTELEESSTKAQFSALQNQLNPHFLFNSLNTLISEIKYSPDNAVRFTRNLSDVYRYILQCQDLQQVSLLSELEFLKSYVFLHQVRLGNCILTDNQLEDSFMDAQLPPLTLQLLAENIIKHNTISINHPMTIHLEVENKEMLVIRNRKRPKITIYPSGKGLQNLASRYQLLCNKPIIIEQNDHYFTVKVPLLYE